MLGYLFYDAIIYVVYGLIISIFWLWKGFKKVDHLYKVYFVFNGIFFIGLGFYDGTLNIMDRSKPSKMVK